MDLVYEKYGNLAGRKERAGFRLVYDLTHFFYSGTHGGEGIEFPVHFLGDYPREGGLSDTRRTPENEGAQIAALYHIPYHATLSDEVFLARIFIQIARSHPLRQGRKHTGAHIFATFEAVLLHFIYIIYN